MKTYLAAYFLTLVAFLVIDFIWLSTMASRLYRPAIGDLLADNFRLAPAIIFISSTRLVSPFSRSVRL